MTVLQLVSAGDLTSLISLTRGVQPAQFLGSAWAAVCGGPLSDRSAQADSSGGLSQRLGFFPACHVVAFSSVLDANKRLFL